MACVDGERVWPPPPIGSGELWPPTDGSALGQAHTANGNAHPPSTSLPTSSAAEAWLSHTTSSKRQVKQPPS